MKFTIFKINEIPMYIPSDSVGIMSVCNNKNGTEFHCYVKGSVDQKRVLHLGNRLDIRLVSLESTNTQSQFKLPDIFFKNKTNSDEKMETISDGIEVVIGDSIIRAPFIKGGVQSVMITINKNKCTLNVGGMMPDNELLDYHDSVINVGDNISISLKSLKQISAPICKRPFKGCDCKNENL